jgi:hypothetical protein
MKKNRFSNMLMAMAAATLTGSVSMLKAEDSSTSITAQPAAVTAPAPKLSDNVAQVLQLAQAKLGDDTIIAYIKNSKTSYSLDTGQIVYLRQQGVSDAVLTTMLCQPKPTVTYIAPTMPAPPPAVTTVTVVSTTTNIQVVAAPATSDQPPPPVAEKVVVAAPGPEYVWVPGAWVWHDGGHHEDGRWIWIPGYWAVPPAPRAHWVPGYWERTPFGGRRWRDGHWAE